MKFGLRKPSIRKPIANRKSLIFARAMNMKTQTIPFIIGFLFVFFLSSCTPQTDKYPELDIGDGGLLSGEPCSAPCFQNITPGVTTEEQALKTLSSLLDTKSCDRWEKIENGGDRGIRCSNIGLTFNDQDIVNAVSFEPSEALTVDEIINKYGNPDGTSTSLLGI